MQKQKKILAFLLLLSFSAVAQNSDQSQEDAKMAWWKDAKFGLFLHWGLYSATAGDWKGHKTSRGEQFMMVERIPIKEYTTIADTFNPVHFNAEKWVLMAKNAGMKYIVITAKHHDGFAMYDSKSSDFNIVKKTPYAHDPMKDLSEACRKYGIKFGFYYSLGRDWEDPNAATDYPTKGGRSNTWDFPNEDAKDVTKYYHRKILPQIKELVTQYGNVDVLWFDTPERTPKWESQELMDTIHKYQPDCIVNSRIGNGLGDYRVYEQSIVNKILPKPWEACVTISSNWAYSRHDSAWKSTNVLIRQLSNIVSKGGNYLLNVSPKGDGSFPNPSVMRLDSIGQWLSANGEAIYGARPWIVSDEVDSTQIIAQKKKALSAAEKDALDAVNDATSKELYPVVYFTQKGNTVYAIICNPIGKDVNIKKMSSIFGKIQDVKWLGSSKKVNFKQTPDGLQVKLPSNMKNTAVPVFVLKINKK